MTLVTPSSRTTGKSPARIRRHNVFMDMFRILATCGRGMSGSIGVFASVIGGGLALVRRCSKKLTSGLAGEKANDLDHHLLGGLGREPRNLFRYRHGRGWRGL